MIVSKIQTIISHRLHRIDINNILLTKILLKTIFFIQFSIDDHILGIQQM